MERRPVSNAADAPPDLESVSRILATLKDGRKCEAPGCQERATTLHNSERRKLAKVFCHKHAAASIAEQRADAERAWR